MDHLISASANNYADNISCGPLKSMASPICLSAFYYYNADISVMRSKKISLLQRKKEGNILSALSLQNEDGVFWDFSPIHNCSFQLVFLRLQVWSCKLCHSQHSSTGSDFFSSAPIFYYASSVSVEIGIYFSISDIRIWQIRAPMSLFFKNS